MDTNNVHINIEINLKTEPEERHVGLSERNPLSPGKKGIFRECKEQEEFLYFWDTGMQPKHLQGGFREHLRQFNFQSQEFHDLAIPAQVLRKLAGEHATVAAVHLLRDVLQYMAQLTLRRWHNL